MTIEERIEEFYTEFTDLSDGDDECEAVFYKASPCQVAQLIRDVAEEVRREEREKFLEILSQDNVSGDIAEYLKEQVENL